MRPSLSNFPIVRSTFPNTAFVETGPRGQCAAGIFHWGFWSVSALSSSLLLVAVLAGSLARFCGLFSTQSAPLPAGFEYRFLAVSVFVVPLWPNGQAALSGVNAAAFFTVPRFVCESVFSPGFSAFFTIRLEARVTCNVKGRKLPVSRTCHFHWRHWSVFRWSLVRTSVSFGFSRIHLVYFSIAIPSAAECGLSSRSTLWGVRSTIRPNCFHKSKVRSSRIASVKLSLQSNSGSSSDPIPVSASSPVPIQSKYHPFQSVPITNVPVCLQASS